jgi:hypothetical protein
MPRKYTKSGPNRSAFIRSMPSAPVAEVIAAAKKQGIKNLKAGLVYAVRAADKKGPKPNGLKPGPKPKPKAGLEQQFIDVALELGIGRAMDLLARVRKAVSSVAG